MINLPHSRYSWQIQDDSQVPTAERVSQAIVIFYRQWEMKFGDRRGKVKKSLDELMVEWSSEEKIFELAIESGAEECTHNDDYHEIQCSKSEIYNVKKKLEKTITNFISTEIEWVPLNNVKIEKDKKEAIIEFLETLEEDDAVRFLVLAASSGEKPGPLVSLFAGQKSGKLPVPIVIVPQNLSDEAIDDLASRAE